MKLEQHAGVLPHAQVRQRLRRGTGAWLAFLALVRTCCQTGVKGWRLAFGNVPVVFETHRHVGLAARLVDEAGDQAGPPGLVVSA
jgi:hypothetical protein